jgi:hypothetical protein
MAEERNKSTRNLKERISGFIYVALLFMAATFVCCLCLSYYSGRHSEMSRKEFAIVKMERIRRFQLIQDEQMIIADSIFNKIKSFNPSIQATYEENDIKYYLNEIKRLYEENSYDRRYKIFFQISGFYNMWFADKKELWSKNRNIEVFKRNLESCEIGLQKKKEELKNAK